MLVLRRDGEHFQATFHKLDGKWIHFFDHDPVRTRHVRSLAIIKGTSDTEGQARRSTSKGDSAGAVG